MKCQRFAAALNRSMTKTPTDKEKEVRYNEDNNLFVGRSLQEE